MNVRPVNWWRPPMSARQRVLVLTFATADDAAAWDALPDGQALAAVADLRRVEP